MLSYQTHTHEQPHYSHPEPQYWGRLTSINPKYDDIKLVKPIYTIGRGSGNDIPIPDIRLSNVHCIISRTDDGTVMIEDKSLNGTYLNDKKIGNRNSKALVSGDMIQVLYGNRIPLEDVIGFCLSVVPTENNMLKRRRDQEYPALFVNDKQIKSSNIMVTKETIKKGNECVNCSRALETRIPGFQAFCKLCMTRWVNKVVNSDQLQHKVQEIVDHTLESRDDRGFTAEFRDDASEQEFEEQGDRREIGANIFEAHIPQNEIETTAGTGNETFGNLRVSAVNEHQEFMSKKMERYYNLFKQFTSSQ